MPIPSDDNLDPLHHDNDSRLGQLNHTFSDSLSKLSSCVTSMESMMTQIKKVIYQCMDSVHKSLSDHIQAMNDLMDKTILSTEVIGQDNSVFTGCNEGQDGSTI